MSYDQRDYPYDTVVLITETINGVRYQGSGVLVSPDEVLTAASLLYQSGQGAATDIVVTPAADPGYAPFGSATASTFHYYEVVTAPTGIAPDQAQYDFAVIHLDQVFSGLGWMGIATNYPGGDATVTGYPVSVSGHQYDTPITVSQDPDYSLLEGPSLGLGSVGGPLWVERPHGPYAVGVVTGDGPTTGRFAQITTATFDTISGWIAQDEVGGNKAVEQSSVPLVDPFYYDASNPDVAAAGVDPGIHYITSGWHEGRDPDAYFSTVGYLAANPDVRAAGYSPVSHYDATGWREGRDPYAYFNTRLYLLHNPDVAAAGVDPLLHYLAYGEIEGRGRDDAIGPAASVVGGFAPEFYLLANPDVARSGYDPLQHFLATGWQEHRDPNPFFDVAYYLQRNPDVAAAGVNPLLHYDLFGWREDRDPSAEFSTSAYLAHAPDVAAAHTDPLEHYLQFGIYEGRQIG